MACAVQKECSITKNHQVTRKGGETFRALRESDTLRVGFSDYAPWAMKDASGRWIGFDLDVMKKLATDLILKLEFVPVPWKGIIDDLLAGKFDIIVGSMTVTPERARRVAFSAPYTYNKTVLLLNRKFRLTSLKELNQSQYRFAVVKGYATMSLTSILFNQPQIEVFDNNLLATRSLVGGQADAVLMISPEAVLEIARYPDRIYIPDLGRELAKENGAFALPKDVEAAWLAFLNDWIETNWKNGFLEEKARYWLESIDWRSDYQLAE